MKKSSLITGLVLAFLASACTVDSTPEAAIATASTALQKNDLKTFQEILSGSALEQFGTEEGMTILQDVIGGAKIRMTSPQDVAVKSTTSGPVVVYAISILNQETNQKLLDLKVDCDETAYIPRPTCLSSTPGACGPEYERCSIDAIRIIRRR
jgi:hypothetical protein